MNEKKSKQILQSRSQLKRYFKNGLVPSERHFSFMIDSMSNKLDDGFDKDEENGLMISPTGRSKRMVSFFDSIDDEVPSWYIGKEIKDNSGLSFSTGDGKSRMFLHESGNVGIGTNDPTHALDVQGFVGMQGRIGNYASGSIPADGKWWDILTNLNHCQAFEVVARVGAKGSGKYSLLHATALATFGKSHCKIRKTVAHYGFFWNKLRIRWSGDTYNYKLQLSTWRNYGDDEQGRELSIRYNITKLWDDEAFIPHDQLHESKNIPKATE